MLKDLVWYSVADQDEMLCIECIERRLGRELIADDFIDAPINNGFFDRSDRMLDRLARK